MKRVPVPRLESMESKQYSASGAVKLLISKNNSLNLLDYICLFEESLLFEHSIKYVSFLVSSNLD